VGAQGGLIAPGTEQDELARIIARKDAEVDALRLGSAGVGQLGEEGAQITGETDTSVNVGHQHYLNGHRE
jgi:hypothetical protein